MWPGSRDETQGIRYGARDVLTVVQPAQHNICGCVSVVVSQTHKHTFNLTLPPDSPIIREWSLLLPSESGVGFDEDELFNWFELVNRKNKLSHVESVLVLSIKGIDINLQQKALERQLRDLHNVRKKYKGRYIRYIIPTKPLAPSPAPSLYDFPQAHSLQSPYVSQPSLSPQLPSP